MTLSRSLSQGHLTKVGVGARFSVFRFSSLSITPKAISFLFLNIFQLYKNCGKICIT